MILSKLLPLPLAIWLLLLLEAVAAQPIYPDMLDQFKKDIAYDQAIKLEKSSQMVQTIWPSIHLAPGLEQGAWKLTGDDVMRDSGGIIHNMILRRDEEYIEVVIFSSYTGVDAARDYFLTQTTATTMMAPPYKRLPEPLGTIAVAHPLAKPTAIYWLYRNICFAILVDDSNIDAIAIARWLQSIAEAGVVNADITIKELQGKIDVTSLTPMTEEVVEVNVVIPDADNSEQFKFDIEYDDEKLEIESLQEMSVQFYGLQSGPAFLDLYLIDKLTLTPSHSRLTFDIQPKSE